MPTLDILLATYNGERFLEAQLQSLLSQTVRSWALLVRDDGSRDGTLDLLRTYRDRFPDRIRLLEDGGGRRGVVGNFSALLQASTGDFVMFCDQDDVWLPDKLDVTLQQMQTLTARHGGGTPLLVFTDLVVVDEQLRTISPSFWNRKRIDPRTATVRCLLTQNIVTGCTAIINRSLARIAAPIPDAAVVHDWWVALLAALLGFVAHVPVPTVLYRQHGLNTIGARPRTFLRDALRVADLRSFLPWAGDFRRRTLAQAGALYDRVRPLLDDPPSARQVDLSLIERFARLDRLTFVGRKRFLLRNRLLCGDARGSLAKLLLF